MAQNYYDCLGIPRDASVDEIKKGYRKAALQHHPDKGGDPEKFKELAAANDTLTDERKRSAYDSTLLRSCSRDGLGGNYARDASSERGRAASQNRNPPQPSAPKAAAAGSRPPRPPAGGAVEIPADPGSLSIKELKELLTALGIDHEGCLEKADLLEALQQRKDRRQGRDSTPRGSSPRASQQQGGSDTQPDGASSMPKPSQMAGPRALRVKVMSMGSSAVGKSTLIKRYCEGRFVQKYITTIGIDYGVKPVKIMGLDVKVNFFDTSGGDEFKDIRVEFYAKSNGALVVYDVNNRKSFTDLDAWLEEAQRHGCPLSQSHKKGDMPVVILCANKTDSGRRAVTQAEGTQYASKHGMLYYETSAATGESVEKAMSAMFEKIVGHHLETRKKFAA